MVSECPADSTLYKYLYGAGGDKFIIDQHVHSADMYRMIASIIIEKAQLSLLDTFS